MKNVAHNWSVVDKKLVRSFHFSTFSAAIAFVTDVGRIAEIENHHPNILVEYTTVTLTTVTRDKGNTITDLDHRLASKIDENYIL
jgi:4a-hydroxytetrahydrobiopterin dehydratase